METILQRFREEVDNLAEKAREEIKEKFVGKGAIVIVENLGGQKASLLKTYIIGIPNGVDKEHLALNVDKLLRVSLMDYSRKAISWEITDPCVKSFDTIFYQDNIRFLTMDIIDEIVKEATSFIPRRTKAKFKKVNGANTTRMILFTSSKKESDEHMMTIVDFVEIMKTELTKFIKED